MSRFYSFFLTGLTLLCALGAGPARAQDWQGAWDTTYGPLRLIQDGDQADMAGDTGAMQPTEAWQAEEAAMVPDQPLAAAPVRRSATPLAAGLKRDASIRLS